MVSSSEPSIILQDRNFRMEKIIMTNKLNYSTLFGYAYTHCFATADYGIIFFYSIMSLCFLVGTPAHSWCLWFYLRGGWRIKANQKFIVHHIIIELIGCIENTIQIINEFVFQDATMFYVDNFIFGASWAGRPLIQTCICIERYVAVIHPVTFLKYKAKYELAGLAMVYLISSGYGLYEINYYKFPDPVFNSVYFLAVIVMLFCCVSVLCALKKTGPGDKHGNRPTGQEEENLQKKKAFNIIRTHFLIMLLNYVPMLVLTVCYVIKDDWILFQCVLGPMLGSISIFSLIITPLMKIYKEGYLRCLNQRN